MTEILIFIVALCFYLLGRWSIRRPTFKKPQETIDQIVERARAVKTKPKIKGGIMPFKKSEDFTAEAIHDKQLEIEWIRSGKAEEIMR